MLVRLLISAEAYLAICASLASGALREPERSTCGGYFIWLVKPHADLLAAARWPRETYSDVIIRLAALEAGKVA
jgi:hypothetical protein